MSKYFFRTLNVFLFFLSLFLTSSRTLAQENNNWYFGRNAGLSFNISGNQPIPSVLANGALQSPEASASVSDENGDLLFYTNGLTVYNRLHQIMFNGDNLDGNASACQVSIVPVPGSDFLFYIFTADAFENDFLNGYRYSIVDMSKDFGNGEVISRNNLLWPSCSERIASVRHANGIDIWVITNDNNSNIFRAWLIDCNGLQTTPVVSASGLPTLYPLMNVGVLKASPDGKTLCQTHSSFLNVNNGPPDYFQLLDFDNATGLITNPRSISIPNVKYPYGEFSPNSKLLYLTSKDDKIVDQLEITLPTIAAIEASRVSFPTTTSYYDIQLAPDGKIYMTQANSSLAVINQPDNKGVACNFQRNQISLYPGSANLGLPSHINDIVSYNDINNGFTYTILDSCSGSVQFNAYSALPANIVWNWDFSDGSTATAQNPVHIFANPKQPYIVKLTISSTARCGKIIRSKFLTPSGLVNSSTDFTFTKKCDSGYVRFTNTSSAIFQNGTAFIWNFGDGDTSTQLNPVHSYTNSGSYNVKLKLSTGTPCLDDSVIYSLDYNSLLINVIPDQSINLGASIQLTTTGPDDANYTWTPGTWLNSSTIKSPVASPTDDILYKVTATNSDNCKSEDSVRITVIKPDDINDIYVPNGFTPNNDGKNDLLRPFLPRAFVLKQFTIYNRLGQMVFTTKDPGNGWDGKIKGLPQNNEVFVWTLKATDETGVLIERKGSFVLIR